MYICLIHLSTKNVYPQLHSIGYNSFRFNHKKIVFKFPMLSILDKILSWLDQSVFIYFFYLFLDLSPVQQQLSDINNRYGLLGSKLSDRQAEIDSIREEIRKHLDNLRALNNFLDKVCLRRCRNYLYFDRLSRHWC